MNRKSVGPVIWKLHSITVVCAIDVGRQDTAELRVVKPSKDVTSRFICS
jgi:hypothetical protein